MFNNENIFNVLDPLIENNLENIDLKYAKAEALILNENWEELLIRNSKFNKNNNSIIEFIDTDEANTCMVAMSYSDLISNSNIERSVAI